ncbi:MAG: acetyl-CoA carboxylase biotin carboxyl carrier protein [Alphaproteobacteria bacterium]|nr:acetyl-CoA carboxylase biotin carboxyl carrier protein [Alphaproteobacteria bacterium]
MGRLAIDPDAIRELARLLDETGLSEIEVGDGSRHLRVARGAAPMVVSVPAPTVDPTAAGQHAAADAAPAGTPVTSPMVGTAYLAPEPNAAPFVRVGDTVNEGQTLLVIEAMKVMNPIRAPRRGRVAEVRVASGSPVEFGEVLVVLG